MPLFMVYRVCFLPIALQLLKRVFAIFLYQWIKKYNHGTMWFTLYVTWKNLLWPVVLHRYVKYLMSICAIRWDVYVLSSHHPMYPWLLFSCYSNHLFGGLTIYGGCGRRRAKGKSCKNLSKVIDMQSRDMHWNFYNIINPLINLSNPNWLRLLIAYPVYKIWTCHGRIT